MNKSIKVTDIVEKVSNCDIVEHVIKLKVTDIVEQVSKGDRHG